MAFRGRIVRLAYANPKLRSHLLPLLHLADAGGESAPEEEATSSKGKGPPPKWDEFLKAKYEGGKKKIPNPNPETRKDYPTVSLSTALKDKGIYNRVLEEYKKWIKGEPEEKKPEEKKPEEKKPEEKKPEEKKPEEKAPVYETLDSKEKRRAFVQKAANAVYQLNPDHKNALKQYTENAFLDINSILRTGKRSTYKTRGTELFDPLSDKEIASVTKAMDEAFAVKWSTTPSNISLTRGVDGDHPLAKALHAGNLQVGTEVVDKGFMSTTIQPPSEWVWEEPLEGEGPGAKMVINCPKGTKGLYLEGLTSNKGEYEFLLNRGTRLRVASYDAKARLIVLEVVA